MTKIEIIQEAIRKGITYNKDTGEIFGISKKLIVNKDNNGYIMVNLRVNGIIKRCRGHQFAFYFIHGYLPNEIDHIDRNPSNNRIANLKETTHKENCKNRSINPNRDKNGRFIKLSES